MTETPCHVVNTLPACIALGLIIAGRLYSLIFFKQTDLARIVDLLLAVFFLYALVSLR